MSGAHILCQSCHFHLDPHYRLLAALHFAKHHFNLLLQEGEKVQVLSVFGQEEGIIKGEAAHGAIGLFQQDGSEFETVLGCDFNQEALFFV